MFVVSIAYFDCTQLIALRKCTHVGAYNMNIYYIYYKCLLFNQTCACVSVCVCGVVRV